MTLICKNGMRKFNINSLFQLQDLQDLQEFGIEEYLLKLYFSDRTSVCKYRCGNSKLSVTTFRYLPFSHFWNRRIYAPNLATMFDLYTLIA